MSSLKTKYMYRIICLLFLIICCFPSPAQERFNFKCDVYEGDIKTHSNLNGKILCDVDGFTGKYCLLISVPNPRKRGREAFGYCTDPDQDNPKIKYYSTFPYDKDLKKVYSIISDEFELMIFVKYNNGDPFQIVMSEKGANNESIYITVPYSETNYNGIYNIINYSKKKIHYTPY